jgi:sialic acid synthase SpsE
MIDFSVISRESKVRLQKLYDTCSKPSVHGDWFFLLPGGIQICRLGRKNKSPNDLGKIPCGFMSVSVDLGIEKPIMIEKHNLKFWEFENTDSIKIETKDSDTDSIMIHFENHTKEEETSINEEIHKTGQSKNINSELYELSKDWILTKKDHLELQKHSKKNKIDFFSTPFGLKSAKLLQQIKVPFIKIASGEITNQDLIIYISKMKIPMLVSTGMTTISEIAEVVEIIKQHNCPFTLLHCVSSYPTLVKDANLSTIQYLKNTFNVPVGFSDHTTGIEVSLAAVALGASIIEKHFTTNKNLDGRDNKFAILHILEKLLFLSF